MNLYKDLSSYCDEKKKLINVVVEIPKGSQNKYEYDEEEGVFKLDRVLHHSMFYPFDYGFVPQTKEGDGDAVDVFLLASNPSFPGCVVRARVIGVIDTMDERGKDPKIISVPDYDIDPRWADIEVIDDLPKHLQEELLIFFKEYKKLETEKYDKVIIHGFGDKKEAYGYIDEGIKMFKKNHRK